MSWQQILPEIIWDYLGCPELCRGRNPQEYSQSSKLWLTFFLFLFILFPNQYSFYCILKVSQISLKNHLASCCFCCWTTVKRNEKICQFPSIPSETCSTLNNLKHCLRFWLTRVHRKNAWQFSYSAKFSVFQNVTHFLPL